MQIKYFLAFLLTCVFAAPAFADSPFYNDPGFSYEEAFIGLYGGGQHASANFTANPNGGIRTSDRFNGTSSGQGGAELGYYVAAQRWYFGVAVGTQPVPANMTLNRIAPFTGYSITNRVSLYDYANIDALPGFYLGRRVLFYLRAGAGVGAVSLKQINNTYDIDTFNSKKTLGLGRAGLGLDVMVTNDFSVGADYIYTQFARADTRGISPIDGLQTTLSVTSAKENFVGLHVRYNFGGPDW